ncbi:hypothetical protein LWI29_003961 [Acer saccharum]|uniref:DUF4283 domain-containing protein n=1 Tax=Acer saccharum TaxID=4024 RepID=A0AA39RPA5_ACESA|nr:hypothetical protein LWI29_003961 [Acer saccharum]
MAGIFRFSAQPDAQNNKEIQEKPPDPNFSSKRPRSDEGGGSNILRKPVGESFKSKLLSACNPNQWQGFSSGRGKLKISEGDITISEGLNGPSMKLSEDLKNQLCKPWSNALILKVMGRNHTLNFMQAKLRQKWQLIGHWQLTDLEEGYFVVRFQMLADLEYVLTEGP